MTEEKMSFLEHLDELRSRLIRCLVASLAGMFAAYSFYNPWILNLLKGPLDSLNGNTDNPFVFDNPLMRLMTHSSGDSNALNLNLHFIAPMEVFMIKMEASFFAGLILVSPYIFYQVWRFVSLGLTPSERGAVRVFFPISVALFLLGCLIAYFIMLPIVLYFLIVVSGEGLVPTIVLSKYISVLVMCCVGFGVIFELPLVILFLTRLGVVSPAFLAEKRRHAIVVMLIVAAVLTPPDVVTQMLMAVPMIVLYETGVWVSRITWARRQKEK